MSRWPWLALLAGGLFVALIALPGVAQQGPTQAELNAAASNASDWLLPNHDYSGQRFVEIAQITRQHAPSTRPVCSYEIGGVRPFQHNPVVSPRHAYLPHSARPLAHD